MDNIRKEFIKEIMLTLKIEGVFNSGTIADEIQHIPDTSLRAFHKALFGTSHSYLNGMDRIIKVAEQFKPIEINPFELKAKVLIVWCESANEAVYDSAKKSGRTFDDEMKGTKFLGLSDSDLYVLNQVRPYCSLKGLIGNIRCYQDSKVQLQAFIDALKYTPSDAVQIGNPIERLRINR